MRCEAWIPSTRPNILLVGEAPGAEEEKIGLPFVGSSGKELDQMLSEVGIDPASVGKTNVFMDRPPNNKLASFCTTRAVAKEEAKELGWPQYSLPALKAGQYVRPYYALELLRLASEIREVNPNLLVALGNTALWALCGITAISKNRGTVADCKLVPGKKVLPTYHPAAILRAWDNRVIMKMDLLKAKHEAAFPEILRPKRKVLIPETVDEAYQLAAEYLWPAKLLCLDIENPFSFISCVGFGPSSTLSIVFPFIREHPSLRAYWSPSDEPFIWTLIRDLCLRKSFIGQNGLYDIQHLCALGIIVPHYEHDLMFEQHAQYLELPKGLGFQGSVYTNEAAWKELRPKRKTGKYEE